MSELDAVRADATAPVEGVVVPLVTDDAKVDITVPPPGRWYDGASEALHQGRFSDWAELALDAENAKLWKSCRKRYDDIEMFLGEWSRLTGENPGKSLPSRSG